MKKIFSLRVWILIFFIVMSFLAINPNPWASGIVIKGIEPDSPAMLAGVKPGEQVLSINHQSVSSLPEYNSILSGFKFKEQEIVLGTDNGIFSYNTTGSLGFAHDNLTIISASSEIKATINKGMKILSINNNPINSAEELTEISKKLFDEKTFILKTDQNEYPMLITRPPGTVVGEAKKSNINKGLELEGGTRVLLKPVSDQEITDQNIQDLIDVLSNRLNVYGVSDIKIRSANDLAGNKFALIEIAGATREEVRELIAKQGKFEARIGNDVAFIGGKRDVTFVCRNDGSCSGVRPPCTQTPDNQYACTFQFAITITQEAAERHAEITKDLEVNSSGDGDFYLSKKIDLYLDDRLVDSLNIGSDLKGKPITDIAISGPGYGPTEKDAYDSAIKNMNRLQTILITGSLPFKIEIAKMDTVSPVLGEEFLKNSIVVGIVAIIAVALVIFIRYRQVKVIFPIMLISLSEVFITLGVAALIGWNMDLASIAGIIAAVGTGVNDQIVITDEMLRGGAGDRFTNWKEKIKRAFSIILAAYVTLVAAMIPLWSAGAGLVRGFAVTTIIGVTIGVLITRPAFGSIVESVLEK